MIGETSSNSTFAVNRQGLLNVIDIRGQFGGFADETFDLADAIIAGPGKFIDDSVRLEAIELAKHKAVPYSCEGLQFGDKGIARGASSLFALSAHFRHL